MLKRNAFVWCLIGLLLFSLTACAKKKPLETAATTTTETTTQTMLLTTEGAAVTTTETTLPVTEGIEVTTTTETGTTATERSTLPEEQRTTVICSLPTTVLCTVTTTELPPATTTRLTGPDTVVTAPQTSWNPSTTTTTATAPTTVTSFDKTRQLALTVNGEAVRLSFDHEEVRYVHKNGETDRYGEYHYAGVSPTGVKVQCVVIPSENVIADIRCDLPLGKPGETLPLSEVRAFVVEELCRMGFAVSDEQITSAGNILDKQFPHQIPTYSYAVVQLSENEYISVTVVKKGDALCVLDFYARKMQKERDFIISEAYPYLVPNWV